MAKKVKNGRVLPMSIDMLEFFVSQAELHNKEGNTEASIESARKALNLIDPEYHLSPKAVSLRIFIARGLGALGDIDGSNSEYRALLGHDVFMPPIILGLMHNNLATNNIEKTSKNMNLVRILMG